MDDLSDSEQVYATIYFMWGGDASDSELTLHNRTYKDALKVAKQFGYQEPCWYKPWTWKNGVVTVG